MLLRKNIYLILKIEPNNLISLMYSSKANVMMRNLHYFFFFLMELTLFIKYKLVASGFLFSTSKLNELESHTVSLSTVVCNEKLILGLISIFLINLVASGFKMAVITVTPKFGNLHLSLRS